METIEAYQTTDGEIFEDYDKAVDYQEGLTAHAFLEMINIAMPEKYRNYLTSHDWHQVLINLVQSNNESDSFKNSLIKLLKTIDCK